VNGSGKACLFLKRSARSIKKLSGKKKDVLILKNIFFLVKMPQRII